MLKAVGHLRCFRGCGVEFLFNSSEAVKQKLISTEYYELHALTVRFQLVWARASCLFLSLYTSSSPQ